ncbi:MAG: amino acid-binding protein [Tannerellaceae bacterium]|nr:amino acid-binding protein [Tannerellaceae bacterium]
MLIKQLSIFLENKRGRFTEVSKILGEAGVNMSAFTVAENSDFGILRLIVSDVDKALEVLREKLYAVSVTEVICLQCPNQPGALAKAMEIITAAGIFVEYMYAFSQGEVAHVVIRPDDVQRCAEVLKANKLELIAANDLYKL